MAGPSLHPALEQGGGRGGSLLSKPEPLPNAHCPVWDPVSAVNPASPTLIPIPGTYELLSALTNQKMPLVLHFKFTLSFPLAINLLNAFIPQKKFPPLT